MMNQSTFASQMRQRLQDATDQVRSGQWRAMGNRHTKLVNFYDLDDNRVESIGLDLWLAVGGETDNLETTNYG